ncbi:hypothetical protein YASMINEVIRUS_877 [Yasminevirus sp. GU-2018]|uniref:Protease Do-like PDZ domain-containing protein n=1 Tax=Yasminevirus sp. GU-2018 TaxID=2420051 RepID=A0A5K0UAC0_9VIRU|nr:hypothetical protein YASMINEVIRUS_877 [Yasminevirus sp. GU-2018]
MLQKVSKNVKIDPLIKIYPTRDRSSLNRSKDSSGNIGPKHDRDIQTHNSTKIHDVSVGFAHDIDTAKKATVRITSHCETRDIFNPDEVASRGRYVGTGFFINPHGHILTCHHVVSDSVKILINTVDEGQKSFPAKIVGVYPEADLAVIKILGYTNKLYFKLGDSECCDTEADVVAIGYPLGGDTVKTTKGIISGVEDHLIQTDTTINGGNSGGPLLNTTYEVIGVNTSKQVGDAVEGTGYCVPINIFKTVQEMMMIESGVESDNKINIVYKPNFYCGFQILEEKTALLLCHEYISRPSNKQQNESIEGYMITYIFKSSPLAVCENPLGVYDVIMEFNGKKLDRYGNIDTETSMGKMNIHSYVMGCKHDTPINVRYFSVKRQMIVSTTIIFRNVYNYKIPEVLFPNKINYVNLGGVVMCELTINHITAVIRGNVDANIVNLSNMYSYILSQNREHPVLFISKVLPDSDAIDNDHISTSECAIVTKVNGVKVRTVDDLKLSCKNYITIGDARYILVELASRENVTIRLPDEVNQKDSESVRA